MNTENTKAVLAKLFGKTHAESMKQILPHADLAYYPEEKCPFGIHIAPLADGSGQNVSIGFKHCLKLLAFTLRTYPSCCGTMMFHAFSVDEARITQAQLDEILTTFFAENGDWLGGSRRLEVMMVERRPGISRDPRQDVEPVKEPRIIYKTLWDYFHSTAKRVRTRLEVNYNTGNVIHNMEVIL